MLADSDRLLSTVEQVLKAGEVTQHSRRHTFEPLDLCAVAREAVARALDQNDLRADSTALALHLPARALMVSGNADELHTAFGNLLSNAVKYSPQGLAATVSVFVDDQGLACFQVSDRGIGIEAVHLKRIFKRFYRVPVRSVLRKSGTGLGLFLVRTIAKRHGGNVAAASAGEGTGATFTLRLPQLAESLPAASSPIVAQKQTS